MYFDMCDCCQRGLNQYVLIHQVTQTYTSNT